MEERDTSDVRGDELAETDPMPQTDAQPDGPRGKGLAETDPMREGDVDPEGPGGEGIAGAS